MHETPDIRLKRMLWRSNHRGCKETDIVLGRFSQKELHRLDDASLTQYEALLDEDDADIWSWLVEKIPCPPHYNALLMRLRHFNWE